MASRDSTWTRTSTCDLHPSVPSDACQITANHGAWGEVASTGGSGAQRSRCYNATAITSEKHLEERKESEGIIAYELEEKQ